MSDGNLREKALQAVGLNGYNDRNLQELSSGEVRRAFIAHTLCSNSSVIMLDEPFSHLDWNHQHQLAKNLVHWKNTFNTTFVLALHELEWAVKIADQVCALGHKSLLAAGTPEQVFQSPEVGHNFGFRTLIDKNPIDGSLRLTLGMVTL